MLPILLLACRPDAQTTPLDLSAILSDTEARAGVITDEDALFGGISAEGQLGDIKLYNSVVRFVLQGDRDSDYYVQEGGGLLDADVIRPSEDPGRDLIDEASPMIGLGRIVAPDSVEVIQDGTHGGAAIVRVVGHGAPFELLTGALENPALVPDRDLEIETLYVLEPGSPLLHVQNRVSWEDVETTVLYGDLYLLGLDVADVWLPGRGLDGETPDEMPWMGLLGSKNEVALGIFSEGAPFVSSPLADVLQEAAPVLAPLFPAVSLNDGEELAWSTFIGVASDPADLVDAWYNQSGTETVGCAGTVRADGDPVAGARVHLLDDAGAPVGIAFTDDQGAWSARLPAGLATSAVATGRGAGILTDLPGGAGWYGPYAAETVRQRTLSSLSDGATVLPFAEGYGVSTAAELGDNTALTLTAPGRITVSTSDGLPAVVRVAFTAADPVSGVSALVPGRPSGLIALGYARDGQVTLPVEPGTYTVTVHRGPRWELHQETVTVEEGGTAQVSATLTAAYTPTDVWSFDGHMHASPSSDGEISMEDRLIVTASHGLDVHLGTDHDHVADYRPLLAPLGLDAVLQSVVADEVSPVLRGHFNTWPLQEVPDAPDHGAVLWWQGVDSTSALFQAIRAMGGTVLQANHPTGSKGLFGYAEYDLSAGAIGDAERWSEDFDAVEVLNSGDYDEYLPYYLDLINRGLTPTPTGVSDSHGYTDDVGISFSYAHHAPGAAFTPEALADAVLAGETVVSRGPYIEATIGGVWAPGNDYTGPQTLEVAVYAPSWMPVDTLTLLRDGVAVSSVPVTGTSGELLRTTFELNPEADASYVVIASGSGEMTAYPGRSAWAMTAALRVDVAGDGWTPPLPPLTVN